jgi:hypothetical protein
MNFAGFRSRYKGPINKFAYFGMLGDTLTAVGIFMLYKYWQARKEAKIPAQKKVLLEGFL